MSNQKTTLQGQAAKAPSVKISLVEKKSYRRRLYESEYGYVTEYVIYILEFGNDGTYNESIQAGNNLIEARKMYEQVVRDFQSPTQKIIDSITIDL